MLAGLSVLAQAAPSTSEPFTWQVVQDHSWAPLAYTNAHGEPEGLLVDIWRRVAAESGHPLEFRLMDWQESLDQVRGSSNLIHAGMFLSDERQQWFDFSLPLFYLRTTLFVRNHHEFRHLLDITDVHDREVGVVANSYEAEFMQTRHPRVRLRFYPGKKQLILAALQGEIVIFVADYPGGNFYLEQHGGAQRFRVADVLHQQSVHAAVAKGNAALLENINRALTGPGAGEIAVLTQKWLHGSPLHSWRQWLRPALLSALLAAAFLWLLVQNRRLRQRLTEASHELDQQGKEVMLLTGNMSDWVWTLDKKIRFSYVSPSVRRLLGIEAEALHGQKLESIIHQGEIERTRAIISHLVAAARRGDIRDFKDLTVDLPLLDSKQRVVWTEAAVRIFFDEEGNYLSAQGTSRDITERRRGEEAMRQLAFNDPLTQLPNRRLLSDRLRHALAGCSRHQQYCAVFLLDLDNFKYVNDNHGHDNGDLLLQQVAQRLSTCLRESDTLGRFGGDDFIIIAEFLGPDLQNARQHALRIAIKVLEVFDQDFMLPGASCHLTASIGIVLFNDDERSIDALVRQADNAMCQAKSRGRNQFFLVSSEGDEGKPEADQPSQADA